MRIEKLKINSESINTIPDSLRDHGEVALDSQILESKVKAEDKLQSLYTLDIKTKAAIGSYLDFNYKELLKNAYRALPDNLNIRGTLISKRDYLNTIYNESKTLNSAGIKFQIEELIGLIRHNGVYSEAGDSLFQSRINSNNIDYSSEIINSSRISLDLPQTARTFKFPISSDISRESSIISENELTNINTVEPLRLKTGSATKLVNNLNKALPAIPLEKDSITNDEIIIQSKKTSIADSSSNYSRSTIQSQNNAKFEAEYRKLKELEELNKTNNCNINL
jgi:hypothetical protein